MNSNPNKRIHRVMVSLTETARKGLTNVEESCYENEMKMLDNKSVLLRIQNSKEGPVKGDIPRYYRHLEFDSIGYEHDPQVRAELVELMDQTFRLRCHGCLVRLTPVRTHNLNLITRLLVAEVDKMMQVLNSRLKAIRVDYYDVRKFDMVQLMSDSAQAARRQGSESGRQLQSTRELFHWLVHEYSMLKSRGIGDDYLDLEFVFRDGHQKVHKVHFSLFQIFSCDERLDVSSFFQGLPLGRNSHSSLLTDCLKESFDFKRTVSTLVLFEVPMGKESLHWLRKMLKLADTAYVSLKQAHSKCSAGVEFERQTGGSSNSSTSCSLRRRAIALSQEDHNSLSYWYARIDTKFQELQISLKQHYKTLYRQKSLQICSDLSNMSEDFYLEDTESGGDSKSLQVEKLPINCPHKDLLKQIRELSSEVEKSSLASTLKTYLNTKNCELTKAMKTFKQKEMENLRLSLMRFMQVQCQQ